MPNNKNAEKAMKQNEKCRIRNRAARSALKTLIKKVRLTARGTDAQAAEEALKLAAKRLDQAASKNIMHKNKAARLKSRLVHAVRAGQKVAATATGK